MKWNDSDYLAPRILQLTGLLMLVGAVVFWALTGRESVLIVSSAMTLIGGGALRGAWSSVKQEVQKEQ